MSYCPCWEFISRSIIHKLIFQKKSDQFKYYKARFLDQILTKNDVIF